MVALLLLSLGCVRSEEPTPETPNWEGRYPGECSDGADNDGDGAFDCFDSDCAGAPDCLEVEDSGSEDSGSEDTGAAEQARREQAWQALVDYADEQVRLENVAGLSWAVVLDGEVAYTGAAGVTQYGGGMPVRADTVFRWNSVSKLHTALAALELVEEGALDLSAPVSELAPEASIRGPGDIQDITLHDLMTHHSGMEDWWDTNCPEEPADAWAKWPADTLVEPGSLFNYSNTGWSLTGLLIERSSGQDFNDYMAEHVLAPAGMDTASFDVSQVVGGSYTIGYDGSNFYTMDIHDCGYLRPAAALHGTSTDLAKMAAIQLDTEGGVFSASALETLQTAQVDTGFGNQHGYGLYRFSYGGHDVLTHSGGGAGHSSYFLLVPELDFGVVVAANVSWFSGSAFSRKAAELFVDLVDTDTEDHFSDPETWDPYTGTYEDPTRFGTIEVSREDRFLYIRFVDGSDTRIRLYQYRDNEFFYVREGSYTYLRFMPGPEGEITWIANRYWVGTRSVGVAPPPESTREAIIEAEGVGEPKRHAASPWDTPH